MERILQGIMCKSSSKWSSGRNFAPVSDWNTAAAAVHLHMYRNLCFHFFRKDFESAFIRWLQLDDRKVKERAPGGDKQEMACKIEPRLHSICACGVNSTRWAVGCLIIGRALLHSCGVSSTGQHAVKLFSSFCLSRLRDKKTKNLNKMNSILKKIK